MQCKQANNASKAVGCGIFGRFSKTDKRRREAAGDVISGMVLGYVGMDVPARLGNYRLNNGRFIQLSLAGPVLHNFVQYLVTFSSRPEADNDVVSNTFVWPIVLDKYAKFRDPSLNRSREIPAEGGIFDSFSTITSDRK